MKKKLWLIEEKTCGCLTNGLALIDKHREETGYRNLICSIKPRITYINDLAALLHILLAPLAFRLHVSSYITLIQPINSLLSPFPLSPDGIVIRRILQ